MHKRLYVTHLVLTSLLVVTTCALMFFSGCETVQRADGRSGRVLGVVISADDLPRSSGLGDWILAAGGVIATAMTGGGLIAVDRRAKKRHASDRHADRESCPAPASLVEVAPGGRPDPENAS